MEPYQLSDDLKQKLGPHWCNYMDSIKSLFKNNSIQDGERMQLLNYITEGVCRHCGRIVGPNVCHCENDD